MYFTIERLAAERVADFRRELDRSGPTRPRGVPPLVRALLRGLRGRRARVGWAAGPILVGGPAANLSSQPQPTDLG